MNFEKLQTGFLNAKVANYVLATATGNEDFELRFDEALQNTFVADAGGILTDMKATAERLGRPLGKLPNEFTAGFGSGTEIIVTPNHTGWQFGEFLVENGRFLRLDGDTLIDGRRYLMWWDGRRWYTKEFTISSGYFQDDEDVLASESMKLGWDATPIVVAGSPVPLPRILNYPRIRCDARNLVDFANGNTTVDQDFFQLIRPLLPTHPTELIALLTGADLVISRPNAMTNADFQRLKEIITEYRLSHLEVGRFGQTIWLSVKERLPFQRMPLVATGHDKDHRFMAVAVDGRQPDSVGCTITELGQIMAHHGAVFASLGGGGGDVFIGRKQANGSVMPINTPSNKYPDGSFGAARRSPNALIITEG